MMMLHGSPSQSPPSSSPSSLMIDAPPPPPPLQRKRPAESQDNERLSKRLSLLNLEQNGSKLYVPVETPSVAAHPPSTSSLPPPPQQEQQQADDAMQLEDSKYKVYIYSIDDELADEHSADEGKLIFLPDIEKHLRENRIPPHVLANKDGELAGMQLVLYSDPRSLSVPESRDGVRKAIIEARHRHRENQRLERLGLAKPGDDDVPDPDGQGQTMEIEPAEDPDVMEMEMD